MINFTNKSGYFKIAFIAEKGVKKLDDDLKATLNEGSTSQKVKALLLTKFTSVISFPICLAAELFATRIPKVCKHVLKGDYSKAGKSLQKVGKFALGILLSPLGLLENTLISSHFHKRFHSNGVSY
jgi:hypothetical protein